MVVSGFVDGAVEQDEVSPAASDVEVLNGNKGDGLDSESRREGGLCHREAIPFTNARKN